MKVLEKWSLAGLPFVFLGGSCVLLGKVLPANFADTHLLTYSALVLSFVMAFALSMGMLSKEKVLIGFAGYLYFSFMCFPLVLFAFEGEELNVWVAWVLMTTAALGSLAVYVRLKMTESEVEKEKAKKEEIQETTQAGISLPTDLNTRFHHPDFDFVLENLEKDVAFLQQHEAMIGLEALHKLQKMLNDMHQAAYHYQHTEGVYQQQAEAPIENLCTQAEMVAEELKERVQTYHVQQIEKLTYIHTK